MLAPSKVLFWIAVLMLPLTFAGLLGEEALMLPLLAYLALGTAALGDWLVSRNQQGSVSLEVPDFARLTKEKTGELEVVVVNPSKRARKLRVALALPTEVEAAEAEGEILTARLPKDQERVLLRFELQALRRGVWVLPAARTEQTSRLGFWLIRAHHPLHTELRVYPNLSRERAALAGLFMNKGVIGAHLQRQLGKGREFDQLREYVPGDSYEDIHWKATAKRNEPITKMYRLERTQEIYVAVDTSRLSVRPLPSEDSNKRWPETACERYITTATLLGMATQQQGDLFGLMTFSDKMDLFLRAKNGREHQQAIQQVLLNTRPKMVSPDFEEVFTFLRLNLRRRALIIFLTDLSDPVAAEMFQERLHLISRKHLVLTTMLRHPDTRPLFDDQPVETTEQIYRRLSGHMRWHDLRDLQRILRTSGVTLNLVPEERMAVDVINAYIAIKKRQVL